MVRAILVFLINGYQKHIAPFSLPRCRFYPSCSEYAKTCLHQDSVNKALLRICHRLLRCNPWNQGGVDLP